MTAKLEPDELIRRIKKALSKGGDTHTWEDVYAGLQEGKYQFFQKGGGVCITQVHQAPQVRYLHYFIVAGDMQDCLDLQPEIEAFAKAQGCKYVTSSGRMGWRKVLPNYGWKETHVVYQKELINE